MILAAPRLTVDDFVQTDAEFLDEVRARAVAPAVEPESPAVRTH